MYGLLHRRVSIPLAEQTGLMGPLSGTCSNWPAPSRWWRDPTSISQSRSTSRRGNLQFTEATRRHNHVLAKWEVQRTDLGSEVTESAIMADPAPSDPR